MVFIDDDSNFETDYDQPLYVIVAHPSFTTMARLPRICKGLPVTKLWSKME